jgi:hypothetical protein
MYLASKTILITTFSNQEIKYISLFTIQSDTEHYTTNKICKVNSLEFHQIVSNRIASALCPIYRLLTNTGPTFLPSQLQRHPDTFGTACQFDDHN